MRRVIRQICLLALSLGISLPVQGDYVLSNADSSGRQVHYKMLVGIGTELLYFRSDRIAIGLRFERLTFSQQRLGAGPDSDLSSKLTTTSLGALIHVAL